MYAKQMIILLVVGYGIIAPDVIFGFEIISTTTERDMNKDGRCQQSIIQTLENNLQQQQNFCIRKEQMFEKKMEETSVEFGKKQKEFIEIILNKENNWLQQVDQKIEKISSCELRQTQREQLFDEKLKKANTDFGNKQKELIETVNKQNILLQQFDQKIEKINAELMQHFDKKIEVLETKLVNIQQELLKQFKKEIENTGTVAHRNNDNNNDLLSNSTNTINSTKNNLEKVEPVKTSLAKNCMEILKRGDTLSGVYTIQPINTSFEVWCDMNTRGGGWTYVLNRFDGSQDFYLDWAHYKNGFGNLRGELWLGLQHLYELTGFQDNKLLIELVDWDNNKHFYGMYTMFRIGSEEEGYFIKLLKGYSGDVDDALKHHKNIGFSTYDRDQDTWNEGNCADLYHGPWWYKWNSYCNFAGNYFSDNEYHQIWIYHNDNDIRLKKVKMMVRPNSLQ